MKESSKGIQLPGRREILDNGIEISAGKVLQDICDPERFLLVNSGNKCENDLLNKS